MSACVWTWREGGDVCVYVCGERTEGGVFFSCGESHCEWRGPTASSLKFVLSVQMSTCSHCAAPLHSVNVCVCVPGVTQLYCTISVIHLFICHRCYHGYYRLTAVFSLRRTQVRGGRGDQVKLNDKMSLHAV